MRFGFFNTFRLILRRPDRAVSKDGAFAEV
jgi:hypothetical protein